jgi:hypothetical protein
MTLHHHLRAFADELEKAAQEASATDGDPGAVEHFCRRVSMVAVALRAEASRVEASGCRELFVSADSELSAIAHGRPPSSKAELLRLSDGFRKLY